MIKKRGIKGGYCNIDNDNDNEEGNDKIRCNRMNKSNVRSKRSKRGKCDYMGYLDKDNDSWSKGIKRDD